MTQIEYDLRMSVLACVREVACFVKRFPLFARASLDVTDEHGLVPAVE